LIGFGEISKKNRTEEDVDSVAQAGLSMVRGESIHDNYSVGNI
jgi:hypothetical protein